MRLLTLGRLGLSGAAFTRPKPLMLLAYLALEGPQAREQLVEVFFGGEAGGAASLRTTLRRLRQAVPDVLRTDRDVVATSIACDAAEFQLLLGSGELARGTAAYAGAFMLGVGLPEWTVELEGWLYRTRERLADQQRRALLDLALLDAQRAEFSAAADAAARAVELPEATEPTVEQLRVSLLLLAAGPLAPPPPLLALARREGLPLPTVGEARAELLDGRWRRGEAASLPNYGTSFVGRGEERAVLLRTLAMPDVRLVTLVGPGGIGKTRLAREAARVFPQRDEVAFVEVEPHMTVQQLPTALARALRTSEPTATDPLEGVLLLLNRRSVLLVLDSAELFEGGFGWLSELLRACPSVKVLVTSRERLTLDEAWTLHLRGLTLPPERATAHQVRQAEAAQLFLMRAHRQQLDLQVGLEDLQVVGRICAAVGGSPLGLELAAAWVRLMPLAQIEEELRHSLDLLEGNTSGQPRHHSVRAVFNQSWARLPGPEQSALARLSVFAGGWTADAARDVAQADRAALGRLVDASLVEVTADHRYRLHPLIQQFAAEHLRAHAAVEERTTAARRAHMQAFVVRAGGALRANDAEGDWTERVHQEFENIRQSLAEWLRRGDAASAADCLNTLRPFWVRGTALPEIRHWYDLILQQQTTLSPPELARTLRSAGEVAMNLGDDEASAALMSASLAHDDARGVPAPLTHLLLGQVAWRRHDLPPARHHYEQAHRAFVAQGNQPGIAASLNNLGAILIEMKELLPAKATLQAALAAKREAGGDQDAVLVNLGAVLRGLGEYGEARAHLLQAIHSLMRRGYQKLIPEALDELGQLALDEGRAALAVQLLSAATAHLERLSVVRPTPEQMRSDRAAAQGEAQLGRDAFAAAWQAGRTVALEDLLREV